MSVFEGEEDFTPERTHDPTRRPRQWQVNDLVRVVDGPRMLLGATGTVVEIDVPGEWPIRVRVDRGGFDRALLAPHELEPIDWGRIVIWLVAGYVVLLAIMLGMLRASRIRR